MSLSMPNQLIPAICTGLPAESTIWLPDVLNQPGATPLPGAPSTTDASEMLSIRFAGLITSSLTMVPVAEPSATVTPDGLDRVSVNVSSVSAVPSPVTVTLICWDSTPGAKVMVPLPAV